jgi:lipopolysaccharide export system protein LptA
MSRSNSAIFKRVYGVIAAAMAAFGCAPERGQDVQEVPPGIAFEGLRFRTYRGSRLLVSGQAERASLRRDNSDLEASGVEVRLPNEQRQPELLLQAPAAQGNLKARRFEISGGVVATRGTDVARTDRAVYDGSDGLVHGDRPVAIRGDGYTFDGPRFTLNPSNGRVAVEGGARLTWRGRREP